jgi:uncharacterized protein (DUF885 family)
MRAIIKMKRTGYLLLAIICLYGCAPKKDHAANHANLPEILNKYWEERMQLFPLEATANGDNRYNDKLTITIAESFRDSLSKFYQGYLNSINLIDSTTLEGEELVSYRLFKYEMQMGLEGLKYPTHYMPINQFWGFTLEFPQLGSGEGNQPFKTVKDYENFLQRIYIFPQWVDTAIYNMRKGMTEGWVLPKALVVKILPQLKNVISQPQESIFYGPVKLWPDSLGNEKERMATAYTHAIDSFINPSYKKLYDFFEREYLPSSRNTSGINALKCGESYYDYCTRYWTTTNLSPDSIYNIGLAEVERLQGEMNKVKDEVGYTGSLQSFFEYLGKDKQFYPFTTPQEVLDSFWNIKKQEAPVLKTLFNDTPKTAFTIRQTEAFRAASASAEYNPATADGSRPGIFYVPILSAKQFNAVGMTTLFLHEAIPGHHYQISLQQENNKLPTFRRFLWYGAYGEGWALYSETLGTELGLYNNRYQYFGHLSDAMHRAIRLVVDVGMHHKGMSREDAITYMMVHERTSKEEATAEIERYMAIPAQALSYKIGQLSISALREKYQQKLGDSFNIAGFHREVLQHGVLPLAILAEQLEAAENNMKKH